MNCFLASLQVKGGRGAFRKGLLPRPLELGTRKLLMGPVLGQAGLTSAARAAFSCCGAPSWPVWVWLCGAGELTPLCFEMP